MKNKRLWLSVALTVLVVVCAMLILSRINEARSNAAPAAPTDLILPPDIQTTATVSYTHLTLPTNREV